MQERRPSVRMTDDEIWAFVKDSHTGIFTTLRLDGSPVALPVWFVLIDRTIFIRTRGKKLQRVRANAVSSFLAEDGERWTDLRAVHLSGRATVEQASPELAARFSEEYDLKYRDFRLSTEELPESSQKAYSSSMELVRFEPTGKVLNWNNAKLMG